MMQARRIGARKPFFSSNKTDKISDLPKEFSRVSKQEVTRALHNVPVPEIVASTKLVWFSFFLHFVTDVNKEGGQK